MPSPGWWKKNCLQFGAPAPDEGEMGERDHLTLSAVSHSTRYFSAHSSLILPVAGSG